MRLRWLPGIVPAFVLICAVGLMRVASRILLPNRHFSRPPGWFTGVFWYFATVEEVKGCLKAGADPKTQVMGANTPLHMAVFVHKFRQEVDEDTPAIITALLEAGADIEARNVDGATPLHLAAANNENLRVTGTLIMAGANLNAKTEAGLSVLDCALLNKNPAIVGMVRQATHFYNLPVRPE